MIAFLVACADHKLLPTATIQVDGQPLVVEVASTSAQRAKGLMDRAALPADEGMLFVYPDERPREFWMKDTRVALSIAYVDQNGEIVRITDMTPYSTDKVPSLYPAKYAIEVNKGWFASHGVEKGDHVAALPQVSAE